MRFILLTLFMLSTVCGLAQFGLPPKPALDRIDSIYLRLFTDHKNGDTKAIHASLQSISSYIDKWETKYPLFCGIMQMHQLYYSNDAKQKTMYRNGIANYLKNSGTAIAEIYSPQLFWLIEGFYIDDRMSEWLPVDSMIREEIYQGNIKGAEKFSISEFANLQLGQKNYFVANNLAKYDEIFFKHLNSSITYDKLSLLFTKWIQLKQSLDQWLETSYTDRNNLNFSFNEGQIIPDFLQDDANKNPHAIHFKAAFDELFEGMKKLYPEMVKDNSRSKPGYNAVYRGNYFYLYSLFVNNFHNWAVNDHKIPEAILVLKNYITEDIFSEEIPDARKAGQKPALPFNDVKNLVKRVANMYYEMGNASEASDILIRGQKVLENYPGIQEDEFVLALIDLIPIRIRALRLEANYTRAHSLTQIFKNAIQSPDSLSTSNLNRLEWYGEARVEEVFTLMAQNKQDEATDTLIQLIDFVDGLPTDNEELIYSTRIWTNLQYLTSLTNARRGKWNVGLIQEMIADLLRNDQTHAEIFYPAQMLAVKAIWFNDKKIHKGYLQNILFYTRRQLQNNFILLSAEERMQLYARNMNDYFDVYHELLFSGALDSFPDIKQEVLTQSMHLKNALVDGNIIPDEVFLYEGGYLTKELLEKVRNLRQDIKRNYQNAQLFNLESEGSDLNDRIQEIWLKHLTADNAQTMRQIKDWKQIAGQLQTGQLYLETVRYKRWLSDSAIVYGLYIIDEKGSLQIMDLCTEEALLAILNEPGSSPQTSALTATAKRGNELLGKGNKKPKTFSPGDKDLLGELLLQPIAKYFEGKQELLMVHDGLLNRISFAALLHKKQYLLSLLQIRQLSGSNEIGIQQTLPERGAKALLAGGLQYGQSNPQSPNRLFVSELSWPYLPGTRSEIEMLEPVFQKQGFVTDRIEGNNFPDSSVSKLPQYDFIHLATHGFYYDSTTANLVFKSRYNRDALQQEPLFRSGLAISGANNPIDTLTNGVKGYLMGYELANIDLRNCYLISLSACETGLGDLRNNLGVDGLSRALKIAGAKHLLISLWKVPDEPTSVFMQHFYAELFSGKTPSAALQATQLKMSKSYPAVAWAAFIIIE